jgi:ribosomal protein S27AE
MNKVLLPSGDPAGRIICPKCGNVTNFIEIVDHVLLTTHFIQNRDGSFSSVNSETDVAGPVKLFCGKCSADISHFHNHLHEMKF